MPRQDITLTKLYSVIKSELKARGLTYRDVAEALGETANGIRLRFANKRLSMTQIIAIANMLGMSLAELTRKVDEPLAPEFTTEQEMALIQDMRLALVLVCVIDDWSIDKIVATYDISKAQCINCLLTLDRLHFIDLLPNNIVRKRVRRGVSWQPNGPLHYFFRTRIPDFLNSSFTDAFDARFAIRVSLTPAASTILQSEILHLKRRAEALHEECQAIPESELRNIVIFAAEREWELPDFTALRRDSTKNSA